MKRTFIIATIALLALSTVTAIQITSTPDTATTVNSDYEYQVTTDAANTSYNLTANPSGMTVTTDGLVEWTPSSTGTYDVTVQATNESNTSDMNSQSYDLTVNDPAPGQFQASTLNLGDDQAERDQSYQTTYTVQNTGDKDINDFNATTQSINNRYEVSVTALRNRVPAGGSTDVSVNFYIPDDQDADQTRIGSVRLQGTTEGDQISLIRNVNLEAQNGINIDDIEVNGDNIEDGDTYDELEFGDDVEIIATVENVLDDADLEDVEMETDSDLDVADNLNDEVDIDAGDDEELEVAFTLDSGDIDVDDAPWDVTLDFQGEDENNAEHTRTTDFELDLDLEDEDLRIITSSFGDTVLSERLRCGSNSVTYTFDVRNVGEDDLERARVDVRSSDLDISRSTRNLEVDTGDTEEIRQRLVFNERPSPGTYFIDVTAFADGSDSSSDTDVENFELTVDDCAAQNGDSGDTDDDDDVSNGDDDNADGDDDTIDVGQEPNQGQAGPVGEPVVIGSGEQQSGVSDREYVYILAGLVAVLIIAVALLLGKVLS